MRGAEGVDNEQDIEEKTRRRDEKQAALDKIKRGEFVGDYVAEGLYNLNAVARMDRPTAWNMHNLSGKNFVNLSRTSPTFTEAANEKISEANRQLEDADKSATARNFSKVTAKGKERIANEASQKFNEDFVAIKPHLDEINEFLAEKDFEMDITNEDILNPATREQSLNQLKAYSELGGQNQHIKGLVQNLIEDQERIKAVDEAKVDEVKPLIEEEDLMLNMIEVSNDNQMRNTQIPIAQKLAEQLEIEKSTNKNGVSLYSNVEEMEGRSLVDIAKQNLENL